MIIQIAAGQLLHTEPGPVPAGTSPRPTDRGGPAFLAVPLIEPIGADVPAGTPTGEPAQPSHPSTAIPVEPTRPAHLPAGTSPSGPALANHLYAASTASEPSMKTFPRERHRTSRARSTTHAPPINRRTDPNRRSRGNVTEWPAQPDQTSAVSPAVEPFRTEHVPAGTLRAGLCTIRGTGGIEPETARRRLCTGTMLGAVVDAHGDVLALGRTRRLVSKAQRRALMVRDQTCQFPGCVSSRHLQAHYVIPWSAGGPTDLINLILLCQFHHTCVHEGGVMITRNQGAAFQGAAVGDGPAWVFTRPDGEQLDRPGWPTPSAATLANRLARLAAVDHVDRLDRPRRDPHPAEAVRRTIRPPRGGPGPVQPADQSGRLGRCVTV